MTTDHQIKDEKISTWSWGEINKYEYLTSEEILLYNQKQIINKTKFTYSLLRKVFEKQAKTIEDHERNKLK